MMLNDVVSPNDKQENFVINLLTDSDYFLDKTIRIQQLDKDKLAETSSVCILLQIPSDILKHSLEYCAKKLEVDMQISDYLLIILKEYHLRFETQHLTTSSLVYNGRKPRKDVLEKLETIGQKLKEYGDISELSKFQLRCIIQSSLGKLDERTFKKYLDCFKYFTEVKTGQKFTYYSNYNLEGFHDVVLKTLNES